MTELSAAVAVRALSKAFGATQALRDASYELRPGEVHALIGENGSGKSTLIKILSGVQAPDSGVIELGGREMPAPKTPRRAQELGIAAVFQEVMVVESRSVLANAWLGVDSIVRGRVLRVDKRRRASEVFEELLGRTPNLDQPVEELSLSDRQACCIVRALLRDPRLLILDEATSALDVATRDRLFQIVRRLSTDGVGVVFITHRMDELVEIVDRITVLRSGKSVATLDRGEWTPRQLVALMTGSDQLTEHAYEHREVRAEREGSPVLVAEGLRLRRDGAPLDAAIYSGELVGVAGLEGHGQDEFLESLRGSGTVAGRVMARRDGLEVEIDSPSRAADEGIVYVPRERRQASFAWMSIRENFGMPTLPRDSRFGWLRPSATVRRLEEFIRRLGIVLGSPNDRITTLSGGNQQKVMIARWLAAGPTVLLLNDPTRGIDVGAKRDLYNLLVDLTDRGLAVVMLSTEVDELIELMDRVLVFREHELFFELSRQELTRQRLVSAFFGESEGAAA